MARPSDFTQDIANLICSKISEGESLRTICDRKDVPDRSTVKRWLNSNEAFRAQYAQAMLERADYYSERTVTEAEAAFGLDAAGVNAKRLLVDTLKWQASKLAPKKYGDKLALGGADDMPAIGINQIVRTIVDPAK